MATRDTRSPELILAERRARNAENQRKWREKNPERAAAIARRYWEKKTLEAKQKEGEIDG